MAKKDPRVDAYIAASAPFARAILSRFRKLVHNSCPAVEETLKWNFPFFQHHGLLCGMCSFKSHCAIVYWHPEIRRYVASKYPGKSPNSFRRVTTLADLPSAPILKAAIKKAMTLNESGVKPRRRPRPAKPPPTVPAEVRAALNQNPKALANFEAFPPSHQREYIQWITEAKRQETRQSRLAKMLQCLTEGKSRNWKYENRAKLGDEPGRS